MAENLIPDQMSTDSEDRADTDSTISGSLPSSYATKDSSAPNSSNDLTVTDSPLSELSPGIDEPLTSTTASQLPQEDMKLFGSPELEKKASLSKNNCPQGRAVTSDEGIKKPDRLFIEEINLHVSDNDESDIKGSSNLGLANISIVEEKSGKQESNFSFLANPESIADVASESKELSTSSVRSSSSETLADLPEEHWIVRAVYGGHLDFSSPEEPKEISTISFKSVLRKLIPNLEKLLKQFLFLNHLVVDETPPELDCKEHIPDLPSLAQMEQRVLRSFEREFGLEVVPTLRPSIGTLEELKHELSLLKEIMRKSLGYLIKSSSDILAWCQKESNQQTLPESNVSKVHDYAEKIGDIIKKLSEFKERSNYFITNFVGNVDDLAGLTYIMSVRTQIALGYSRLLYELCTLCTQFEKDVVRETFASKSEY